MKRRLLDPGSPIQHIVLLVLIAGASAMVLVGTAAATSPQPADRASAGTTTYRVGVLEEVETLNPFVGTSVVDGLIYHLNYDFLTGYDPVKLEPRPEFAESWSHSANDLVWTFKIRPGMTWQDGQPANAHDVAFTFNYIIKNNLSSYTFFTDSIKSVVALNDATVRFICSKPKADILSMQVPILPQHIWAKVSSKAATTFTNSAPCMGSGPYQVTENKPGSYALLVANRHYWRGPPHIDRLLFITYQNANSMVADLKAGNLDAVVGVPQAQLRGLASSSIKTNPCVLWGFTQLTFNCYRSSASSGNPVLLDPRFRQALQYAVDRSDIVKVAFGGYATAGTTIVPPYSPYHWQPAAGQDYTYDPAKANAMLDAAGYRRGADGYRTTRQGKQLTLRLFTSTERPVDTTIAKLLVGWFAKVGIRVDMSVFDASSLEARVWNFKGSTFAPDFDMMNYYWVFYPDPETTLDMLTPYQVGGWSDTSWTNPTYTRLFDEQSSDMNTPSRIAVVRQMQKIVWQSSPYLIFAYDQQLEAYNTAKWQGYVAAPSGYPGYNGQVIEDPGQIDTYLALRPAASAATAAGGTGWIYALVAIAAAAGVALVVWLRRRARRPETEQVA